LKCFFFQAVMLWRDPPRVLSPGKGVFAAPYPNRVTLL
jgi:hypothetical protein